MHVHFRDPNAREDFGISANEEREPESRIDVAVQILDHILGTRHKFDAALEYIHQNPVPTGPIEMDEVRLPLNAWDRI